MHIHTYVCTYVCAVIPQPTLMPVDFRLLCVLLCLASLLGPFPSCDMKEWFDEGYFTLDLMVRRVCDEMMLPLGEWTDETFPVGYKC